MTGKKKTKKSLGLKSKVFIWRKEAGRFWTGKCSKESKCANDNEKITRKRAQHYVIRYPLGAGAQRD